MRQVTHISLLGARPPCLSREQTDPSAQWSEYRAVLEVAPKRGDTVPLELWAPGHLLLPPHVVPFAWRRGNYFKQAYFPLSFLAGRVGLKRSEP